MIKFETIDVEIPKILYHYTDLNSFMGIIEKKELWASNIMYSNDQAELQYPIRLLLNRLKQRSNEEKLNNIDLITLSTIIEINQTPRICVFSLSTKKDNLSQWRGYSKSVPGICLGIDTSLFNMQKFYNLERAQLVKCKYDDEEHINIIDNIINESISAIERDGRLGNENIMYQIYERLYSYCPTIKTDGFQDENEWRYIIEVKDINASSYCFRQRNTTLLPYFILKIEDLKKVIKEIIIGPNPKEKITEDAVIDFCLKNGLRNSQQFGTNISTSKLTYMNW